MSEGVRPLLHNLTNSRIFCNSSKTRDMKAEDELLMDIFHYLEDDANEQAKNELKHHTNQKVIEELERLLVFNEYEIPDAEEITINIIDRIKELKQGS